MEIGEIYQLDDNRSMFSSSLDVRVECTKGDLFFVVNKAIAIKTTHITLMHPIWGLISIRCMNTHNNWIGILVLVK